MKAGDADAKHMAHEIAVTLATAFTQHGSATTSFTPRLLSCTAKIWDNSTPNRKFKGLYNWAVISDDDVCIWDYSLFHKTIGYTYLTSTPPASAPAPLSPTTLPIPKVASTLSTVSLHSPSPVPMVKHNLFVADTKRRSSMSEILPDPKVIEALQPLPKKCKIVHFSFSLHLPNIVNGTLHRAVEAGVSAQPAWLADTKSAVWGTVPTVGPYPVNIKDLASGFP
ncbi:hypothetical protein DFH29DRAFT_995095 [Suillus ampliporus]|nr:hypothetical protein DFH29DRAFT_995095 [Suillus ampliporus]